MSTDQRIRGRALQEIRLRWFTLHPLCVRCDRDGRTNLATQLDHIKPLFKGGEDTDANRQGLCDACHEAKTAEDMGYAAPVVVGPDGWPVQRAECDQGTGLASRHRSSATATPRRRAGDIG